MYLEPRQLEMKTKYLFLFWIFALTARVSLGAQCTIWYVGCNSGYYLDNGGCAKCPEGSDCPGGISKPLSSMPASGSITRTDMDRCWLCEKMTDMQRCLNPNLKWSCE